MAQLLGQLGVFLTCGRLRGRAVAVIEAEDLAVELGDALAGVADAVADVRLRTAPTLNMARCMVY